MTDERKEKVVVFVEDYLKKQNKPRPEKPFDMRFYVDFFETELTIRNLFDGRDEIRDAIKNYYDKAEAGAGTNA